MYLRDLTWSKFVRSLLPASPNHLAFWCLDSGLSDLCTHGEGIQEHREALSCTPTLSQYMTGKREEEKIGRGKKKGDREREKEGMEREGKEGEERGGREGRGKEE